MPDPRTIHSLPGLSPQHRLRRYLLRLAGAVIRRPPSAVRRPPAGTSQRSPRILLIRPDHLGDVLLATPAFAALRTGLPQAHVTALVGPWAEAVARRSPHLDEVLTLPFPGFARVRATNEVAANPSKSVETGSRLAGAGFSQLSALAAEFIRRRQAIAPYQLAWREAQRLRAYRFDVAVVLRFDHWWGALLAALAGIPIRVGYHLPDVAPFLTHALPHPAETHVAQQNLALMQFTIDNLKFTIEEADHREVGVPPSEFPVTQAEREAAQAWLQARGVGADERVVAVHPGAGAAVKLWTAEGWARVADEIAGWGFRILLTGSAGEAGLTAAVARHMRQPAIDAAGATDLGGLAALQARCALVLGPDAGALHLATAVGTPTVRLYGPINPAHFGPWGDPARHRVVVAAPPLACQFCDRMDYAASELPLHPCVRWIRPEQVLTAARAVLANATLNDMV